MTVQTSYSQSPEVALLGQFAEAMGPQVVRARVARGLVKAGYGVFKSLGSLGGAGTRLTDGGEVYHIPNPAPAADVDAIVTSFTTSTGVQTLNDSAEMAGVVGLSEMQPPRNITFVLSNHADWDATTAVLTGVNYLGQTVSENISIPNGGNATVTSTGLFKSVTSIVVPAQSGTGGTMTVGIAAITAPVIGEFKGVAVRQPIKTTIATGGLYGYPGQTSTLVTADYVDSEAVPCLETGAIWVYSEEAISDGDPVYVRVASGAGGSVLGAFRNDADSASCVLVVGARFCRDSSAAGPAWARFSY